MLLERHRRVIRKYFGREFLVYIGARDKDINARYILTHFYFYNLWERQKPARFSLMFHFYTRQMCHGVWGIEMEHWAKMVNQFCSRAMFPL